MNTPTVNRTILERGHLMPGRRFKQSLRRVSVVRLKSAGAPGSGKLFVHVACACQVKVPSPSPVLLRFPDTSLLAQGEASSLVWM